MKQFQYTNDRGTFGPYDEVKVRDVRREIQAGLAVLDVGATWRDSEGDVWVRLPDLGEAPIISDEPKRDERLERIATAALPALCHFSDLLAHRGTSPAEEAVKQAKALIAELDKQA